MLGRTLVIVNPAARHGVTADLIPVVSGLLDGQVEYELRVTESPGHATILAREANGFDTVVAVGGDGTVHEVLNGLMGRPAADRPALALLPTGTGNDYRRTLGISTNLTTAGRQIIGGVRKRVDIGVVNGVYFANSVAVGLDARVTAKAVELKSTTGWSGIMLYMRALFIVLFRQFYTHRVTLAIDGEPPVETELLLVAATNGPTYGGGFKITPKAIDDDGLLDTCIIWKVSLLGALARLPFVVVGHHGWMRPVALELHRSVQIRSDVPIEGQIDGEVTLSSTYDISILPGALEVIVPERW
ncbi:MAG: diacylglycerol kinase family lipid kinase [Anaerosomatales bacterium]|nr:diacylglycerol kinase family lipid kinase [Anaerosomatales bacterium]MDT8433571.1 diacylglycerol kinase family lipid kinase [Anaerosomatales bacterium]